MIQTKTTEKADGLETKCRGFLQSLSSNKVKQNTFLTILCKLPRCPIM